MAMRSAVRVYCEQCDAEGPDGDTVGEARELATMAGWLIGTRDTDGRRPDYCPQCRVGREFICEYPGGCRSDALYQYVMEDRDISACGKHFAAVLRDLFNAHEGVEEIRVRKLRAPRKYGSAFERNHGPNSLAEKALQ